MGMTICGEFVAAAHKCCSARFEWGQPEPRQAHLVDACEAEEPDVDHDAEPDLGLFLVPLLPPPFPLGLFPAAGCSGGGGLVTTSAPAHARDRTGEELTKSRNNPS